MSTLSRGRGRRGALGAAVVAVFALIFTSGAAAFAEPAPEPVPVQAGAPIPLPPEFDRGFYYPPAAAFADKAPGEIIAARQISVANFGLIPVNVDAWLLSYRSTDTRGEPIPAVATVLKPRGKAPDKLLSMQIAEDSLAGYCSPSYAMQQWSVAPIAGQIVAPAEFVIAQGALQQGWGVVIPDHQGPNNAYAAGPLAGRITLDGIRAARDFDPMRITPDARIGLYGYSGGAIATGHAAELRQSYAPELTIVGAAEGGVPADLGTVLNVANGQATAGLVLGAVMGISREYPDFAKFLNERMDLTGRVVSTVQSGLCVQYLSSFPFLNLKGMLQTQGDPMRDPAVADVLDKTRMGKAVPDLPMYIWQGNPDEVIPVGQVDDLVNTYCQDPAADVRYTREHFAEHVATEVSGVAPALLWMKDRLDGVPAQRGCSTADAGWLALDPNGFQLLAQTFGETFASFFGKPIGVGK
ncbi:triacylglycerol lipase [Nocardia transvalensis]|uniref:Triacylglycerol lipase n=1 Tax=Nocardia transvalensis TaxID=37333 RepID=A0A7W9PFU5_9NOCA|nr:lipase family protein [Nocardia transvalensis]MBB5915130.1 triacylglycerol lipase [Nocardia transvalensis]